MNSTQQLTAYIQQNIPCMFVKYGDGEFYAALFHGGGNCDGTPYTHNLGHKVRESFVYNCQQTNAMMGEWHVKENKNFWESLSPLRVPVQWVDFHTVLIDEPSLQTLDKVNLYKAIKESPSRKIYIANHTMGRARQLFNVQSHVIIDPSNWFDTNFDGVFAETCSQVEDERNTMFLVSAGMGAKYLIAELHKKFPNAIYVDVGSAFDMICGKRNSRAYNPAYEVLCDYLNSILPEDWDQQIVR